MKQVEGDKDNSGNRERNKKIANEGEKSITVSQVQRSTRTRHRWREVRMRIMRKDERERSGTKVHGRIDGR